MKSMANQELRTVAFPLQVVQERMQCEASIQLLSQQLMHLRQIHEIGPGVAFLVG